MNFLLVWLVIILNVFTAIWVQIRLASAVEGILETNFISEIYFLFFAWKSVLLILISVTANDLIINCSWFEQVANDVMEGGDEKY